MILQTTVYKERSRRQKQIKLPIPTIELYKGISSHGDNGNTHLLLFIKYKFSICDIAEKIFFSTSRATV